MKSATVFFSLFSALLIFVNAKSEEDQFSSKIPLFYQWAFPEKFDSAIYSKVFNEDLTPKSYDFSTTEGTGQASMDVVNVLDFKERPVELKHDPIDTSVGWSLLAEAENFGVREESIRRMAEEIIAIKSTLQIKEKIILRRDL